MGFPPNPVDGQTTTVNKILYRYNAINNSWFKSAGVVPARTALKATQLTVAGSTALNAVSANGTLGVAGQVLTSNGSDTYWAPASDVNVVPLRNELNEVINLDINGIFNSVLE